MKSFPLWKHLLVLFALVIGLLYSLPNLYPPDSAVQISGESGGQVMSEEILNKALSALDAAGISYKSAENNDSSLLIRLNDSSQQLSAKEVIHTGIGDGFVVALNLAPNTPAWLSSIGAEPMKLGLDLSGGIHFLLEVDTQFAIERRLDAYLSEVRKQLREGNIRGMVSADEQGITAKFQSSDLQNQAYNLIRKEIPDLSATRDQKNKEYSVHWHIGDALQQQIASDTVSQNLTALRNRVNELGVSEPLVQRQGANRIVVQLPGVQDSAMAKRIIGKIANLEFRMEARDDSPSETFPLRRGGQTRGTASLERTIVITGDQVSNATSGFDENGRPQVSITLDGQGGRQMHAATKSNIGRNLGVLFIERKQRTRVVIDEAGEKQQVREPYFEREIISLATVQSALGTQFRITGLGSQQEAQELGLLLRAGALTAPIDFVEERTIGPSMGAENIRLGINSIAFGLGVVMLFMLFYYRVFGILANLALTLNIIVLVAVMSLVSATLTLPGIAGIVLTIGMAVDANVLIYERIREELRNGLTPHQAISAGYDRAFTSIFDSNITTLIAAIILFAVGTGTVKGFAVTLSIGIATSMFTAITGTRSILTLIYGNRPIKKLAI